jgi:putative membrane protein
LALTATVSFLAEYIGTGYGFPFGAYEYTGLLGFKLGGRVPWVIPLSWFLMGLPSLVLARRAVGDRAHPWVRVVVGAALLTSWDLALDPAMSYLTPYWLWGVEGAFYGMPMINLAGWMFTGILIMLGLERLRVLEWTDHVPSRWWYTYYGVLLAMPLGMVLMAGLWSSVLFTLLAVTLCFLSGRLAAGWSARSPRLAGTPA